MSAESANAETGSYADAMQDAAQKEIKRLSDANRLLSAQVTSLNTQRAEIQTRWAAREHQLAKDLAFAQVSLRGLQHAPEL
jgi:phage host-nuclease inhibitor protein Gam